MAITIQKGLPEGRKRTPLLMIIIFMSLATFFIIYFRLANKEKILTAIMPNYPVYEPQKIEINFEILKNPVVKELELFEAISLPQERGRDKPFLPH